MIMATALPPAALISPVTSLTASATSQATTAAPALANIRAAARPLPDAAPVMMATFPSSIPMVKPSR